MRVLALGVFALLIPACSDHNKKFDVTVSNQGVHGARVEITAIWDADDDSNGNETTVDGTEHVDAGASRTFDFNRAGIHSIRVEIFSDGNGAKVHDLTWYDNDIDTLNGHIAITVAP